jgi:hypothetical protein
MKTFTKIVFAIFLLATANWAQAQQRTCAAMDVLAEQIAQDPKRGRALDEINEHAHQYEDYIAENPNARTSIAVTIPVVFHVVYNNATENISDARLQEQLTVLNEDFRKLNADRTLIPTTWQGIAADCEINFCLATVDPNGNATTGITRTFTNTTTFSTNDAMKFSSSGGKDIWDRNRYLNIWVCDLGSSLLGYAQFPGGAASTDGVVLHYAYTGKTGATSPFNKGRTGTHEVGHWLNLYHIWGDDGGACTGSDQVSDTPNQANSSSGCPSGTRTDACTASSPGIMWMNYMDYTNDACMYMFTAGQKARVQALFAAGGARASLLTSNGCSGSGGTPTYCTASGQSVADEWIQSVLFGPINNNSGSNAGYGNFTGSTFTVVKGTTYNFTLTPGFTASAYPEYWRIWIDYNGDKDFADAGELVYDAGATATTARTGTVTIPTTAATTSTRMRVAMRYNAAPASCGAFDFGEVEDYTLNITTSTACATPTGLSSSSITSSGATISWTSTGATSYNIRFKPTASTTWSATTSTTNSKVLTGLSASTAYEFQVQGVCSGATSAYSTSGTFTTSAASCTDSYEANESISAAKTINPNTTISARICTSTDKDWFKVTTTSTAPKLKVTLSALAADYDIRLYNSAGTQLGISENSGTTTETIIYNATAAATYYIQVYGYNGASSSTAYSLLAATRSTNWRVSDGEVQSEAFESTLSNMEVFPNPANDKFTIGVEIAEAGELNLQVVDMMGKLMLNRNQSVESGALSIGVDVSTFAKGLYLVRAEINGQVVTKRIEVLR